MKKIIFLLLIAMTISTADSSAQIMQKLNGLAVSVNPEAHELAVRFEHPVTRKEILKTFQILPNTNFKNVKRLDQIKPNDPVSVDYQEEKGLLHAIYIEVVSLKNLSFDPSQAKRKLFLH